MRYFLQVAAAVFFTGAALGFLSWLLDVSLAVALALLAAGLLCKTLAAIPDRPS